jgi:hypothetical protein
VTKYQQLERRKINLGKLQISFTPFGILKRVQTSKP